MDSSQQFCLKWNNYHNHVVNAFESLREDEDFVDVTLACDGKKLQAHKMLLSACSPYFRDLLKGNPCKHPIILLRDVKFKDLQALVEFMYCGQVNVLQEQLGSFLKTAEALQVRGLADSNKRDSELREDDDNSRTSSPQISRSCSPPKRFKTHNFKNSDIVNETVMPVVVPKIEVPEEEEEFIGNDVSELQADESVYGEQKVEKDSSMSESGEYPSCSGDIDYSSPMVDANQYSSESQENSVHHHAIAPDPSNETNQSATLTPQDTVQAHSKSNSVRAIPCSTGYCIQYAPDCITIADSPADDPSNELIREVDPILMFDYTWPAFDLPQFDMFVEPYLQGRLDGVSSMEVKIMERKIINQLQDYLDKNNLLNSSHKGQQKCHYDVLKKAILCKYPNIIQPREKNTRDNLTSLISRLAQKRRKKKFDIRKALEDNLRFADSSFS